MLCEGQGVGKSHTVLQEGGEPQHALFAWAPACSMGPQGCGVCRAEPCPDATL